MTKSSLRHFENRPDFAPILCATCATRFAPPSELAQTSMARGFVAIADQKSAAVNCATAPLAPPPYRGREGGATARLPLARVAAHRRLALRLPGCARHSPPRRCTSMTTSTSPGRRPEHRNHHPLNASKSRITTKPEEQTQRGKFRREIGISRGQMRRKILKRGQR